MEITIRYNKVINYARQEAERLFSDEVQPEHLLLGILRLGEGGAFDLLAKGGLVPEEAKKQLDEALAGEPSDMVSNPARSPQVERIMRIAQTQAREEQQAVAGTSHLLKAILRERINGAAGYLEQEWNISYQSLLQPEAGSNAAPRAGANMSEGIEDHPGKKYPTSENKKNSDGKSNTSSLEKYGRDLTLLAEQGMLDPVVGREQEIERVLQILMRRKKNNPILIGEPGVGKSAIVEALAIRLAQQSDNENKDKKSRIFTLDLASMVAGTTYRGQFEERMKQVIKELAAHPEIILFIDEIHTIIGAGNAQGSLDAANILKPALARGEIQCIGATTTTEYAKSIEKDGALERRFQKVMIRPSTKEETQTILTHLREKYESFHGVTYSDEAIEQCVALADRYISDRAFPDKAIDVMDEAGAAQKAAHKASGKKTIIMPDDIAAVVSKMSSVPVQRVKATETQRLRTIEQTLLKSVIGQDNAVNLVVKAIQRNRLGLRDPNRPIGTFFFLGPTGVGKTHLAQTLAQEMFGTKDALIRFDMSEFTEKHTASLLVGAPPGYIAHENGGKLTEAVRRRPYSIILFDEIEKAHPDIFNVLLQVLDEGRLTDRQGHSVDFKNTIIILTSNVGTRQLKEFGAGVGFDTRPLDEAATHKMLVAALNKTFPPEFVNRIDNVITFAPLSEESLLHILDIEIEKLRARLRAQGFTLQVSEDVKKKIISGVDKQYGARPIRRAVQTHLEDQITTEMLRTKPKKRIIISETK